LTCWFVWMHFSQLCAYSLEEVLRRKRALASESFPSTSLTPKINPPWSSCVRAISLHLDKLRVPLNSLSFFCFLYARWTPCQFKTRFESWLCKLNEVAHMQLKPPRVPLVSQDSQRIGVELKKVSLLLDETQGKCLRFCCGRGNERSRDRQARRRKGGCGQSRRPGCL